VVDRLAEIAATGRVTRSVDFENPVTSGGRLGAASRSLERSNWTGHLTAPAGYHVYGERPRTTDLLGRAGVKGTGLTVDLNFDQSVHQALGPGVLDNAIANVNRQDTPREELSQPFSGRQVDQDYQDYTDVLAAEQLGVPDVPGSLSGLVPDWGLQDLGDISAPPAPDWGYDLSDRTQRGPATDPYGFSTSNIGMPSAQISGLPGTNQAAAQGGFMSAQAAPVGGGYGVGAFGPNAFGALDQTAPPDWGMDQGTFGDRGITGYDFGDQAARSGIGLGVSGYGPGTVGTSAFPDIGPYDPLGAATDAWGPSIQSDPFSPSVSGAPQSFANYGDREIGYPSGGFSTTPSQPSRPSTSLADLGIGTVGMQGPAAFSYDPAAVAASTIGAPSMRGMDFAGTTRGIVGYEDTPVTTTTQVPNPAYEAWQEAYNNPKATQQEMYAGALNDKLGVDRGNFLTQDQVAAARAGLGKAPSKTVDRTTTTMQHSPKYGDIPTGRPASLASLAPTTVTDPAFGSPVGGSWGGPDSWGGFGSDYGALSNSAKGGYGVVGTDITNSLAAGLANMNANPGAYGYSGVESGSLSGLGGGYSGGYSGGYGGGLAGGGYGGYAGGYGGIGAATSGNEQQGGAWGGYNGGAYGGSNSGGFSGTQGSDASGRGGLY
jgi:hypothetical protein